MFWFTRNRLPGSSTALYRPERARRQQRVACAPEKAGPRRAAGDVAPQRGLPDPRLARDEHDPSFAATGLRERRVERSGGRLSLEDDVGVDFATPRSS